MAHSTGYLEIMNHGPLDGNSGRCNLSTPCRCNFGVVVMAFLLLGCSSENSGYNVR